MSKQAAKAEDEINRICQKMGVSTHGKEWLDIALDPCKDMVVPKSGYPDAIAVPSVVQTIHDQLIISRPASVPAGSNWDANVFLDELYSTTNVYTSVNPAINNRSIRQRAGQGSTPFRRGGLVVRSGPSGSPLGYTTTTGGLSLKSDITVEGEVRLVGVGLEIHNTTATIDKQGAVITWRTTDGPEISEVVTVVEDVGVTSCIPSTYQMMHLSTPPLTPGEAIDLPGSLEWEAKDGAYVVPILANPNLDVQEMRNLAVYASEGPDQLFSQILSTGANRLIYLLNMNAMTGFCMSGAYFVGLSSSTTLQINLTYYVQVFPFETSILRRSVVPSPGEDATARKLYDLIACRLPTGVYADENFLGGFIAGVSKIAANVTKYLPSAIKIGGALMDVAGDFGMMRAEKDKQSVNRESLSGSTVSVLENSNKSIVPYTQPRITFNPLNNSSPQPTKNHDLMIELHKNSNGTVTQYTNVIPVRQPRKKRSAKSHEAQNQAIYNAYKGQSGSRWIQKRKSKNL